MTVLVNKYPSAKADVQAALAGKGLSLSDARFLPLVSRTKSWVALLRPNGEIVGFAPYDGFF